MPNHVTNKLEISGDQAAVEALKLRFLNNGNLEFNKVVPMPKELDIEAGSIGEWGYRALYGNWREVAASPRYRDAIEFDTRADFLNHLRRIEPETVALGEQYRRNEDRHGHRTWYTWRKERWGTKWDAYGHDETEEHGDTLVLWFHTAWSPPSPVIQEMSAAFPELAFRLVFADEFLNFSGWERFKCGRLVAGSEDSVHEDAANELGFTKFEEAEDG